MAKKFVCRSNGVTSGQYKDKDEQSQKQLKRALRQTYINKQTDTHTPE